MLGAADAVQMLLLSGHGGSLQCLCVALQWIKLFPLTMHVVFMTLQIRSLKGQNDTELTTDSKTRQAFLKPSPRHIHSPSVWTFMYHLKKEIHAQRKWLIKPLTASSWRRLTTTCNAMMSPMRCSVQVPHTVTSMSDTEVVLSLGSNILQLWEQQMCSSDYHVLYFYGENRRQMNIKQASNIIFNVT